MKQNLTTQRLTKIITHLELPPFAIVTLDRDVRLHFPEPVEIELSHKGAELVVWSIQVNKRGERKMRRFRNSFSCGLDEQHQLPPYQRTGLDTLSGK